MTEKPLIDPQERIFTLSDVKRLYIGMKKQLWKWALVGALATFGLTGLRAPKYKVEATFKEGSEKSGGDSFLKNMLGGLADSSQPEAMVIMKSSQVLRPLAERLGIQASVSHNSKWLIAKVFKRLRENYQIERGKTIPDVDTFIFENVVSQGEEEQHYFLSFSDTNHYAVYSSDKKTILQHSSLGEEVILENVKWTISKIPQAIRLGKLYPLKIGSWVAAVQELRNQIQIVSDKSNKTIYNLICLSRDRHAGKRLVNELMHQYQIYLKSEHDQVAKEQISYLENKQNQIYGNMGHLFDEHVLYLKRNLEEKGFIGLEQASADFLQPHREMQNKIFDIDMELSQLEHVQHGKSVPMIGKSGFFEKVGSIHKEVQDLKLQRDLTELSLCQVSERFLETRRDELREVRNQRWAIENLIREIDHGNEITSFDMDQGLCHWAQHVHDPKEKDDLAEYLENYSHLLSLREKMLQERFFYGDKASSELEGIDLVTARQLFVEYNTKLDASEASMRHLEQFRTELEDPQFELGSLSTVLKDPLSQKLIAFASETGLKLKDEKYRSQKEESRWEEELTLQRKILSEHLGQLLKIEEINASLIRDKIVNLQKVSLDCMNQRVSALNEQIQDMVKEQKRNLLQEKKILEGKMEEIRSVASFLPEKWRLEKWLELKTSMVGNLMETITEVVESKTIAHHLHRVGSKPLDFATLPTSPEAPRLFTFSFLGAFFFAFGAFFFSLIRQILRGFPISIEKLQALRLPVAGTISSFCDGPSVEGPTGPDLELLRSLALFAEGEKVIGLIGGKGPDYSFALSENLARMSIRSIVLRCDFLSKFQKEDCPGLLQVWKGEVTELPIRNGKGFDYITAGGYTPFGTEILQSQKFAELVETLKKSYDQVFVLTRTPLNATEATAALRHCDKAAVTVRNEQTEELTPFINWAYIENRCRLTFVTQA